MPLLRVQTSAQVDEAARQGLMLALSKKVAEILGKPEAYVMVVLEPGTPMSMAGNVDAAAFFDVRSVGEIGVETAKQLSSELSGVIGNTLGIKTDRIFGNFSGWQGELWAYSGAPLR